MTAKRKPLTDAERAELRREAEKPPSIERAYFYVKPESILSLLDERDRLAEALEMAANYVESVTGVIADSPCSDEEDERDAMERVAEWRALL